MTPAGPTGRPQLARPDHLESQLTAADDHLADDVLDQIDSIVPPGVTLNPADNGWVSPALEPATRRR